ncbi:BLI-3 blue-light-inducible Bli-3 protein, partial [Coniosporium uncinatum]
MSFSNTDTGNKAADPYTEKNKQEPSLSEKVEDLKAFVERCKFCMMTTRIPDNGELASRCMALAATENGVDFIFHTNTESGKTDDLQSDPKINLGFLNNSGEWAS